MADDMEIKRLTEELKLLKTDYKRICEKLSQFEKYVPQEVNQTSFVSKLLQLVADLFNNLQYSDIRIILDGGHHLNCHKFVLCARSEHWAGRDIRYIEELDFTDVKYGVAVDVIKWVYTDHLEATTEIEYLLEVLMVASLLTLPPLISRCEEGIIPLVNRENCARILGYITDNAIAASQLKSYCSNYLQTTQQSSVNIERQSSTLHPNNKTCVEAESHRLDSKISETLKDDNNQESKLSNTSKRQSSKNTIRTSEDLRYHGKVVNVELPVGMSLTVDDTPLDILTNVKQEELVLLKPDSKEIQELHDSLTQAAESGDSTGSPSLSRSDQSETPINVNDNATSGDENDETEDTESDNLDVDNKMIENEPDKCSEAVNNTNIIITERKISAKYKHKCHICQKQYVNKHNLKVHLRVHTGYRPYKCPDCDKSFACRSTLQTHERIHSGERPYKCEVCLQDFITSGALQKHKRLHTGVKPYECSICSKTFRLAGDLKVHIKRHMGEKNYACDVCKKRFITKAVMLSHKRSTHEKLKTFECETCQKLFSTAQYLKVHERVHTKVKSFRCDLCDQAFVDSGGLVKHKRLHNGDQPYKCDVCGCAKNTHYDLKVHMRTHTKEKPFQCDVCGDDFTLRHQLTTHIRKHTSEKPFSCSECQKTFRCRLYLTTHMKIHSKIKDYACGLCDKSFIRPNRLKKHIDSIHNRHQITNSIYKCDVCNKYFPTESLLNDHLKVHEEQAESPDIIYQCSECEQTYNHLQTLQTHLKIHE